MHGKSILLLFIFVTLGVPAAVIATDHWPQFRGPGSSGVVEDPALPDTWSATQNVAWKTAVPGLGWSSPIVWGNLIFLTTVIRQGEAEAPKKGPYSVGERSEFPRVKIHWVVNAMIFRQDGVFWDGVACGGVGRCYRHP